MRYSTHPWDEQPTPQTYTQPWSQHEADLIAQALGANRTPVEDIRLHAPGVDDPHLARDLGFMHDSGARRALGLREVIGQSRIYPTRIDDFSGSPGGYAGSIRNSLGGV